MSAETSGADASVLAEWRIPGRPVQPAEVTVTRVYLVDCAVCGQTVEPAEEDRLRGGFASPAGARQALLDHLEDHYKGVVTERRGK